MSLGRLLLAALLVAPLASCAGTLVTLGLEIQGMKGSYSEDMMIAAFMLVGIVSFVAILAGLVVVGVPLALLLARAGVPPLARDAIFVLAIAAPAWLLASPSPDLVPLAVSMWAATSLLWVAALHIAARERPETPA